MDTLVPIIIVLAPAIAFAVGATVESKRIGIALVSSLPLGLAATSIISFLNDAHRYGSWLLVAGIAFATFGLAINLGAWIVGRLVVEIAPERTPDPLPVMEAWRVRHWGDSGLPGGIA